MIINIIIIIIIIIIVIIIIMSLCVYKLNKISKRSIKLIFHVLLSSPYKFQLRGVQPLPATKLPRDGI